MSIDKIRFRELLKKFKQAKILVVGDLILDQFIWGDVTRISPEAPVPVVHVQRESFMPGGAANVACSVRDLQGSTAIAGTIGKDLWGRTLKNHLKRKADIKGVIVDRGRNTTLKTRIVARHQQVVRVDREHVATLSKNTADKIISYIKKNVKSFKAIIIEDYGKGVISPYLIKEILRIAKKRKLIITVDPKEEHFLNYKGATCITPNQFEAEIAAGIKIVDKKTLDIAGKKLLKIMNLNAVLITRGEAGMALFVRDKRPEYIPTRAQEVFDVSGAGDTVIGAFTLALSSGASFFEAAHISNYAAGIVVGKLGVGSCSQKELIEKFDKDS